MCVAQDAGVQARWHTNSLYQHRSKIGWIDLLHVHGGRQRVEKVESSNCFFDWFSPSPIE
eukprot:9727589-Prorocentrum_lima.AAC.1